MRIFAVILVLASVFGMLVGIGNVFQGEIADCYISDITVCEFDDLLAQDRLNSGWLILLTSIVSLSLGILIESQTKLIAKSNHQNELLATQIEYLEKMNKALLAIYKQGQTGQTGQTGKSLLTKDRN